MQNHANDLFLSDFYQFLLANEPSNDTTKDVDKHVKQNHDNLSKDQVESLMNKLIETEKERSDLENYVLEMNLMNSFDLKR
ncbi:hypothetical protein BC833DRAFT_608437 [Globomyces pollinis-pini]|nr:hypothetical protein BC833DRAFT_608437 [Globomyces pollinis-pini]